MVATEGRHIALYHGYCQGNGASVSPTINYVDAAPQMVGSFLLVLLSRAFRSLLEMSK